MGYHATKHRVLNRGVPPDSFLDELVAWGRTAPDDIFLPNPHKDIYSNVFKVLGPWHDLRHRRAVMLEIMRVLAGFESSWHWNEGAGVAPRRAQGGLCAPPFLRDFSPVARRRGVACFCGAGSGIGTSRTICDGSASLIPSCSKRCFIRRLNSRCTP
jgi:hypothetical protein